MRKPCEGLTMKENPQPGIGDPGALEGSCNSLG
jgi:hypothetical protein